MAYKTWCVCGECGSEARQDERYETKYCPECNRWLEPMCRDMLCEFCRHEPLNRVLVPE